MYNPNFDTGLRFEKALELLNRLNEYKVDSESDGECVLFIYVALNQKTKQLLCNLGVDISKFNGEIVGQYEEEKAIDIVPIWGDIQVHYGHDLYYDGKKFIEEIKSIEGDKT